VSGWISDHVPRRKIILAGGYALAGVTAVFLMAAPRSLWLLGLIFRAGGTICGNRRGAGGFAGGGIATEGAARNGVWDVSGSECGGRFCVKHGSGIFVGGGFGEGRVFVFGGIVFCWGVHDFAVEGERIRARGVLSLPASLQLAQKPALHVKPRLGRRPLQRHEARQH